MKELTDACHIEARKQTIQLDIVRREPCQGVSVRVASADSIVVGGDVISREALEPWEFHRLVCQRALRDIDRAPLALLPERRGPVAFATSLGGAYQRRYDPSPDRGLMDFEVLLGLAKHRVAVALRVGFQPTVQNDRQVPSSSTAVNLTAVAGPSWEWSGIRVTLLGGVEAMWERLVVMPTTRLDSLESTAWSLYLRAEVEAQWRPVSGLRLALGVSGRGAAYGREVRWLANEVSADSPLSLEVALRVGWYWL